MGRRIQDERGYNQIFRPVGATRIRMERRYQWFVDQAIERKAKRILEIGCGTGEAAAFVARKTGAEVLAIDISETFLDKARAINTVDTLTFLKFDLLADDLAGLGIFDFIFGNGILHHLVVQLPAVLTALRQLASVRGGLAFIEPNLMNPYCAFIFGTKIGRRWASLEPDEMAFHGGDLRRVVADAGWRAVEVKTRDFLVPGLPMALVKPVTSIEPILEATAGTSWLAQSHFLTARANDG